MTNQIICFVITIMSCTKCNNIMYYYISYRSFHVFHVNIKLLIMLYVVMLTTIKFCWNNLICPMVPDSITEMQGMGHETRSIGRLLLQSARLRKINNSFCCHSPFL